MAWLHCKAWLLFGVLLVLGSTVSADEADDGVTVEVDEEEAYHSPSVDPKQVYLAEHFDDAATFNKRWVRSEAKKQGVDEDIAKYDGVWEIQEPTKKIFKNDRGLVLTTEAKHAAISTLLDRPFQFNAKPFIVQYEVTMQEGQSCGGSYIKLLSKGTDTRADLKRFHDQTPYTIMFGPDKCGNDHKLHFIFRHVNPTNGSIEEKHCKKTSERLEDIYKDKEPHLYTLELRPDNTFSISIDGKEVNSGSLLDSFTPPVNPPEEIDDPNDRKPDDWDEREKIVDPSAQKPDDWDESAPAQIVDPNAVKPDGWLDDAPEMIPDPEATKPDDWDDDMDGSWEPPLIDNPACTAAPGCGEWKPNTIPNPDYKGPWRAPLIPNPNYRGKWSPRRIPNPHYFKDDQPFRMTTISAVGLELWSMSPRLLFDNLLITDDPAVAQQYAALTFHRKRAKLDTQAESAVGAAARWAGEHPWVYAVGVLALLVIVGGIVYCCSGSSKDPEAEKKKTDAYTEDEPPSEGEGEGRDEGAAAPRAGKAQLEPQEPEPEAEPEVEAEAEERDDSEKAPAVDAAGDTQRRRKPRRE